MPLLGEIFEEIVSLGIPFIGRIYPLRKYRLFQR